MNRPARDRVRLWPWPCRRYCGACVRCEDAAAREVKLHNLRQSALRPSAATSVGVDACEETAQHAARFGAEVDELLLKLARRREAEAVRMLRGRLQPLARVHSASLTSSPFGDHSEEAIQVALATIVLALDARLRLSWALSASASGGEAELRDSRLLRDAFLLTYDWPGWIARIVFNQHATIARRQLAPVMNEACLLIPVDDPTFTIATRRTAIGAGVARHDGARGLAVKIEPEDGRRKATLVRGRWRGGCASLCEIESTRVIATFSTPRRASRMAEILASPIGERTKLLVVPDDPRRRRRYLDEAGTVVHIIDIYENDICSLGQITLGNNTWPTVLVRPRREERTRIDPLPPELPDREAAQPVMSLTRSLERVIAFVANLPFRGSQPSKRRRVATDLLALCPEVQRLPEQRVRAQPGGSQLADEINRARAQLNQIPGPDTRTRIAFHIHRAATRATTNNVSQVRSQLTDLVRTEGFGRDPSDDEPEDPELIYGWSWLLDRVW